MNFLKKLASVVLKIGQVGVDVAAAAPIFQPFLGSGKAAKVVATSVNDFTAVAQVLLQAQTMLAGKSGADRMTAAMQVIPGLVRTSQLVDGSKIQDEAKFVQGCQELAQGIYDVLDAIHPDSAKLG